MEIFLRMGISGSLLIAGVLIFRRLAFQEVPKRFLVLLWLFIPVRLLIPLFIPIRFIPKFFWNWNPQLPEGISSGIFFRESQRAATNYHTLGSNADAVSTVNVSKPAVMTCVFVIWLSVFLFLVAVMLYLHMKNIKKYGESLPVTGEVSDSWIKSHYILRRVQIRRSDYVSVPVTYGVLRPVILLPSEIDHEKQFIAYILEHEWIHIKRCDVLVKYLMCFTAAVYWFHPLVWCMLFTVNRDIEIACDEAVIQGGSAKMRADYADLLLRMAEKHSNPWPVKACFTGGSEMEERIKAILKMKRYSWKAAALAVVMIFCTVLVFITGTGSNVKQEKEILQMQRDYVSEPFSKLASINVEPSQNVDGEVTRAVTGEQIVEVARQHLGDPYLFGGVDLSTGVDCTGFVKAIYAQKGLGLPDNMSEQAACGTVVESSEIRAGDLVFYGDKNEDKPVSLSHVAIYDGDGLVIHASNAREGVKRSELGYRDIGLIVRVLN